MAMAIRTIYFFSLFWNNLTLFHEMTFSVQLPLTLPLHIVPYFFPLVQVTSELVFFFRPFLYLWRPLSQFFIPNFIAMYSFFLLLTSCVVPSCVLVLCICMFLISITQVSLMIIMTIKVYLVNLFKILLLY